MLERLTRDTFARHLNTHFHVECPAARTAALELIEANAGGAPPATKASRSCFAGHPIS